MMNKLTTTVSLLLVANALSLFVLAVVDESPPDLSAFKLRKVDTKELARQRAGKPITDLATGAVYMRQSLFVPEPEVRCPAYAHLFKLIKSHTKDQKVKQSVVESLAIVAAADKSFYLSRLNEEAAKGELGSLFIEAVNLLEWQLHQDSKDAWLELIGCMTQYLETADTQVAEFLAEPKRAEAKEELAKFKSIPVSAPAVGIVDYLARKLDHDSSGSKARNIGGRRITDDVYNRSNELIKSLDDKKTKAARSKFHKQPHVEPHPAEPEPKLLEESEIKQVEKPKEPVELVVPEPEQGAIGEPPFDESQLQALEFIKIRLESLSSKQDAGESNPKVSMQLALDFQSHWEDLGRANLDPASSVGKRAIQFLQDPSSVAVANRVDEAIKIYVQLVSTLAEIKIQEGREKAIKDLGRQVAKLKGLLDRMDGAFDVDDIRRMYALWKAKNEYNVVEKFIRNFW